MNYEIQLIYCYFILAIIQANFNKFLFIVYILKFILFRDFSVFNIGKILFYSKSIK